MLAIAVLGTSATVLPIGAGGQTAPEAEERPGTGTAAPRTQRNPGPDKAGTVGFQRQVNELRNDLLDERGTRSGRWPEATLFVVLGIAIGFVGLWAYATFRAIATVPTGMAKTRSRIFVPWEALPQPGTNPVPSGLALQPVRLLDPDRPHAGLERGDLKARQGQYEGAIADYDRAIHLDPRNARAYLHRSLAKSGLGRHDEALADLDEALRLDPDVMFRTGDR